MRVTRAEVKNKQVQESNQMETCFYAERNAKRTPLLAGLVAKQSNE